MHKSYLFNVPAIERDIFLSLTTPRNQINIRAIKLRALQSRPRIEVWNLHQIRLLGAGSWEEGG